MHISQVETIFQISTELVMTLNMIKMNMTEIIQPNEIKKWSLSPSLIYRKDEYLRGHITMIFESNQLMEKADSLSESYFSSTDDIYDSQYYIGGEVGINYNTKSMLIALPRRGIDVGVSAGYKRNIENKYGNEFSYIKPMVSFVYPVHGIGVATLATKTEGEIIFGNNYEFYHAATINGRYQG